MPKAEAVNSIEPGLNQKRYLAVSLDNLTGRVVHRMGERKTAGLFLGSLKTADVGSAAISYERVFWKVQDKYTPNHQRRKMA